MKILTKYSTKGRSRLKTFYREMSEKLRRVGKMTSQRETADTNFEFTANMADVHFERLQLNVFRVSYVWQEWFSGNLLIVYQSFVWSSRDRISDWQDFDRSAALRHRNLKIMPCQVERCKVVDKVAGVAVVKWSEKLAAVKWAVCGRYRGRKVVGKVGGEVVSTWMVWTWSIRGRWSGQYVVGLCLICGRYVDCMRPHSPLKTALRRSGVDWSDPAGEGSPLPEASLSRAARAQNRRERKGFASSGNGLQVRISILPRNLSDHKRRG